MNFHFVFFWLYIHIFRLPLLLLYGSIAKKVCIFPVFHFPAKWEVIRSVRAGPFFPAMCRQNTTTAATTLRKSVWSRCKSNFCSTTFRFTRISLRVLYDVRWTKIINRSKTASALSSSPNTYFIIINIPLGIFIIKYEKKHIGGHNHSISWTSISWGECKRPNKMLLPDELTLH